MSRRAALSGALALAACSQAPAASPPAPAPAPPLKSLAPFPVGTCAMTGQLVDPDWSALATRHFSQLTPEWEMKMEYILQDDGSYRWDAPDRIADFATAHGLRLFGTTLVWYAQDSVAFKKLDGAGREFTTAYRRYIDAVMSRYRGRAVAWDVVNEPVAEDGVGLRDSLWSRNLGADDYMVRAFEHAAEADPGAVRFLNDYNLEHLPKKRAEFLRLVERLLKRGTPVGGLGTQSHLTIDLGPGEATTTMRELAAFGLPIHVSELDVSFDRKRLDMRSLAAKRKLQAERAGEVAQAFLALPPAQRFAFTMWGVRDTDSWLRRGGEDDGKDQPLLFDAAGGRKPMFDAVAAAFAR